MDFPSVYFFAQIYKKEKQLFSNCVYHIITESEEIYMLAMIILILVGFLVLNIIVDFICRVNISIINMLIKGFVFLAVAGILINLVN